MNQTPTPLPGNAIHLRAYRAADLPRMRTIWNGIVAAGDAFPQDTPLSPAAAREFFASQTYCAVARIHAEKRLAGLCILHPNNVGRCSHIANASYAVAPECRGRSVGLALVLHSIQQARALGFRILQFNAVLSTNAAALHLYEQLGFVRLGTIPKGFRLPDGSYADIIPHWLDIT